MQINLIMLDLNFFSELELGIEHDGRMKRNAPVAELPECSERAVRQCIAELCSLRFERFNALCNGGPQNIDVDAMDVDDSDPFVQNQVPIQGPTNDSVDRNLRTLRMGLCLHCERMQECMYRDDLTHARTELEFCQGNLVQRLVFRGKGMTIDVMNMNRVVEIQHPPLLDIHVWVVPNANPSAGPVRVSDSVLNDLRRHSQRAEALVHQIGCGYASLTMTFVSARTQLDKSKHS